MVKEAEEVSKEIQGEMSTAARRRLGSLSEGTSRCGWARCNRSAAVRLPPAESPLTKI